MSAAGSDGTDAITDGRLLRGARSRRAVLDAAVDVASLDGLEAVSFGRLASLTGVSKAGVQTLFGSKGALQAAVIDHAREAFVRTVVAPARDVPAGVSRLRVLVENWLEYAGRPLFAGGCFWVANLASYDSHPGEIRDALRRQRREWIDVLAAELRDASVAGAVEIDADLAAFQLDAVLSSTNIALRLGDDDAAGRVRRVVDDLVG